MKALQSQVNPHFLYNALNTISFICRENAERARELLLTLASYYRQTLENEQYMLNLHTELYHINTYLELEKARFEEKLQVTMDIEEDLDCMVPSFILQPLVENAIRYGLEENTEGCLISISAETCPEKDQLIIYVKNDGSAFEDDLLSKLENRQIEPHGFGIGLLNIQKRMQITYGEAYGLTLYNEEELAVAKLVYPLKPVILSPDAEASLTV